MWLTTWWLADATRASLLFLERAVAEQPVFARGVWQAFVWCGAGPVARLAGRQDVSRPPNILPIHIYIHILSIYMLYVKEITCVYINRMCVYADTCLF